MKPILVSGIKPEGPLHVGNFLGSLKNFVDLQNTGKYRCYFFVADLHSLTEEFDPQEKLRQIFELAAEYMAAGLDPKKSTIFLQSLIPAHAELMWLLTAITPEGELRRMTQYKDKVMVKKLEANTGLLTYPILMAADILLYDAEFVPVGEDQLQHLEFTRAIARKFNSKFGKTFVEQKPILTKTPRVMSLDDPLKKMSKSRPAGCLFIGDSPEEIKRKIQKAITDSDAKIKYDEKNKPAISNLLEIYSSFSGKDIKELEKEFSQKTYSEFKLKLADIIAGYFADFRKKKRGFLAKPDALKKILSDESKKAGAVANEKISDVKKKVGILI